MHRVLTIALLVALAPCDFLGPTSARAAENPQVTVFVYNDTNLPAETLKGAELQATKIFAAAGFDIAWRNCPCGNETHDRSEIERSVVLFLHVTTHVAATTSDPTFGVAFLGPNGTGRYGDIFWQKVQELQQKSQVNSSVILGSVMAHEMGHLLLGSNAHAISGIMQAHWEAPELHRIAMGAFLFLPEQAKRMRTRIAEAETLLASRGRSGY